jgi:hypothetical protein
LNPHLRQRSWALASGVLSRRQLFHHGITWYRAPGLNCADPEHPCNEVRYPHRVHAVATVATDADVQVLDGFTVAQSNPQKSNVAATSSGDRSPTSNPISIRSLIVFGQSLVSAHFIFHFSLAPFGHL